jgi:flagellar biosynthesis protein FlhB
MSEDSGEKRFDATPARRERAKRTGNAARSHEAGAIAAFAGGLIGLTAAIPLASAGASEAVRAGTVHAGFAPYVALIAGAFTPALCAGICAVLVACAQTGGVRFAPITFSAGKLAPWPGFKRMFGAEAAVAAARACVAFVATGVCVAPIAFRAVAAASASSSPATAASAVFAGIVQTCWVAVACGALFALADFAVTRRRWLHSLKMTFDEFRRDAKDQDGDPHAKSRRKHLHRTLVRGGIARIAEASFVVVNPTHVAVALRYAPPAVPVPEILVRAIDAAALEVRSAAERAGIPVVEDIALARLLWRTGEAGRPIAPETFVAVATVIAALMRSGVLTA